jgi:iron(II)-dependent oxidoreductase
MIPAAALHDDELKAAIADALLESRRRSQRLTVDSLDGPDLLAQHSALMSPLVWDLAHVGNYEELWLVREAAGMTAMRPELDAIYDAFEHPRAERPSLPLLAPREATGYIDLVRRRVLDSLEQLPLTSKNPLLDRGFVYGMVIQHEHQHDETMLATHQLRRGGRVLVDTDPPPPVSPATAPEALIPAGVFTMGNSDDPWALDNERPAHRVTLP